MRNASDAWEAVDIALVCMTNTFYGMCWRQIKNVNTFGKLSTLLTVITISGIGAKKSIQISTNMPTLGVPSHEIGFEIERVFLKKKPSLACTVKQTAKD